MPFRWRRWSVTLLTFVSFSARSLMAADAPPPGPSEVEHLVTEALDKNPEVRAARATAAAAIERIKPGGALPDPMVTVNYENDGTSISLGEMEMTRLQFMAQQAIPFPGKLRLAEDVARKDAERAATAPLRTELAIAASVRRAYADLLDAREGLYLLDEQAETWKAIEEVTRGRYAAGLANQQDLLRAQLEETRLLQQRQREEAAEQTALSELRQLLFLPPDAPIPTLRRLVPGDLAPVPSREEILGMAMEVTPELKEIALTRERSKLAADLARKNLKPDFVASAGYMNRGGLPLMWSAGVGVSIPLWAGKKQRPLIVEADTLASAAAATEESLRRRVVAASEERLIRLNQLHREARLDADGILVQDRLSVDAALASYRTGSVPFVTVLEALATYFGDRRAAVSRLAGIIRADADLREFAVERTARASMTSSPAPASTSSSPKM